MAQEINLFLMSSMVVDFAKATEGAKPQKKRDPNHVEDLINFDTFVGDRRNPTGIALKVDGHTWIVPMKDLRPLQKGDDGYEPYEDGEPHMPWFVYIGNSQPLIDAVRRDVDSLVYGGACFKQTCCKVDGDHELEVEVSKI